MIKKTLITTMVLGLVIASSAVMSEAQEPLYDEAGNLILDTEQEDYKDLSTVQPEVASPEDSAPATRPIAPTAVELEPLESVVSPTVAPVSTEGVPPEGTTDTTAEVIEDMEFGEMTPASATYMTGGIETIKTEGSLKIDKVEIEYEVGLTAKAWTLNKSNNTITFDKSKLDTTTTGVYTFKVTYENSSTSLFELRVLGAATLEDYWQQNIQTFSKDTRANTHKDLELVSSSPFLDIENITIDGLVIPKSQYVVRSGTIIISKNFLAQIPATGRGRIAVTYFGKRVVDFSLEILDIVETDTDAGAIDC